VKRDWVETILSGNWLGHNSGMQPFHATLLREMVSGCVPMTEGGSNGFLWEYPLLANDGYD
jgi:hypothetical protein